MCGIAGIFSYGESAPPVDEAELLRIREHMIKRGPDGAGLWMAPDRKVGLAHRRLAIIDLSETGAQPMATTDGRLTITYNGEIYNYRELRRELEAKGYAFHSQSDTEVLLHLYADRGAEMVHALRGMFAFGIWDERNRELFLARDPLGIKPLYYADDGKTLRFASQVKALLAGGAVDTTLEPAGSTGFLIWGCVPEPYTLYRSVQALAAGTHLTLGAGRACAIAAHFNVRDELIRAQEEARPFRASDRGALAGLLHDTVRHHLVSDVPVGIFLSAGVDSTLVAGLAMAEAGTRLRSLTLGFEEYHGTRDDEAPLAARTAASLGMSHELHEIRRSDFESERDSILAAMDQPTTDGVNTYFVCRAAARAGIKVALSGLGGDELFGGYPSFRDVPRMARWLRPASLIPRFGRTARRALAPGLSAVTSPKYASLLEYGGSIEGAYLLQRALFMPWEVERTLDPDIARSGLEKLQTLACLAGAVRGVGDTHASVAALELAWYMRNQLLRDADWAGMAHSLEVRVPFVDVRLFRGIAPWLVSGRPPTKTDMAAAADVPTLAQTLSRPKSGFAVPVRDWGERPINGDNAVNRGARGWARTILRRQAVRPLRVLVSTLDPSHGGVRSMTATMVQLLRRRGYAVELAHYIPYRIAPELSVPAWMLPFRAPGMRRGTAFGDVPTHEIGTRLPELEWYRCLPSRAWRNLAQRFDYFIAVSGSALSTLPISLQGRDCLAWIATPYFPDKADRARAYPWYRKLVDRLFDTPVSRRFEKIALRRADVLALSAYTAGELRRIAPEMRCEVMPMPIDAQALSPTRVRSQPGNRIGFCGRFSDPRKNIPLLLRAVARCREFGLELQCEIVGDQPTPEIQRTVQQLGLQAQVRFFGEKSREELGIFYNGLDVFVIPSAQEGLGIVGLEAMACGCPVVSTRCGGPQDYVEDGVNGFLVGFSPDELAAALKRILGDPALYRRMSEAALLTVRQGYGEEKVQRILWDAIDRTLKAEQGVSSHG